MAPRQRTPSSYAAARSEYTEQLEIVEDIQAQLGDRNIWPTAGEKLSEPEWRKWRWAARGKLRHAMSRLRFLKQWVRDNDPRERAEKLELKEALRSYAIHQDDCLWWNENPCSCGLTALLDKYGLGRLERDDFEEPVTSAT